MALTGAKGPTANQIRDGLSLPADELLLPGYQELMRTLASIEDFTLDVGSKVYVHKDFELLESFRKKTSDYFHSEGEVINLAESEAAAKKINDFIRQKTNGKIKDVIQSGVLSDEARLVLVNAIYFQGDWAKPFDPARTEEGDFTLADGSKVKTGLMQLTSDFFSADLPEIDARALEMPYKGGRLSMVFVLPNETLNKTESKLASFDLASIKLKWNHELYVIIPTFKIESTILLNGPLMKLGLTDMFDPYEADFSGMSSSKGLFVSAVVQKAFILVNEEGSEAAADSFVMWEIKGFSKPKPKFICDRPFIFFIRDKLTGMALFVGKVTDPNEKFSWEHHLSRVFSKAHQL